MTTPKPELTPLEKVALETQEKLMRHMEANTMEEDEKREAERDARVAAALEKLAKEGKIPPRKPTSK